MILDRGICTVYRKTSTTPAGGKPTATWTAFHASYYGELSFETAPARPTENREETNTAARVRILQNRGIQNQDTAELVPFDGTNAKAGYYRITRAYHGTDGDNGEAITDLTLEITEKPDIQKAQPVQNGTGSGGTGTGGTQNGTGGSQADAGEVTGG